MLIAQLRNTLECTRRLLNIPHGLIRMYGHIKGMAEAIKKGVDSVEGCEGVIFQVPETLPAEVLAKMHAPPKADYPIIDISTLPQASAFGSCRFPPLDQVSKGSSSQAALECIPTRWTFR